MTTRNVIHYHLHMYVYIYIFTYVSIYRYIVQNQWLLVNAGPGVCPNHKPIKTQNVDMYVHVFVCMYCQHVEKKRNQLIHLEMWQKNIPTNIAQRKIN